MVYSLERVNTCFLQGNVNPIAMPMLPSIVIESSSRLPTTTSVLEFPEPEGQPEIEVRDVSSFVSYEMKLYHEFIITNL
jgi:hypothetical protein